LRRSRSPAGFHLGLAGHFNFVEVTLGMLIVYFFNFDPGWIRGLVRFVLCEEQSDRLFWFVRLDGETSSRQIPKD
jgi:hypothetical protein